MPFLLGRQSIPESLTERLTPKEPLLSFLVSESGIAVIFRGSAVRSGLIVPITVALQFGVSGAMSSRSGVGCGEERKTRWPRPQVESKSEAETSGRPILRQRASCIVTHPLSKGDLTLTILSPPSRLSAQRVARPELARIEAIPLPGLSFERLEQEGPLQTKA